MYHKKSIKHQLFIYTHLKDQTVLFQTIQFSINHSLSLKDSIRCYHSRSEWTWEWWQWRGTMQYPKLQYYGSLTIRLFSVIWGHLLMGLGFTPLQRCSQCILQPQSVHTGVKRFPHTHTHTHTHRDTPPYLFLQKKQLQSQLQKKNFWASPDPKLTFSYICQSQSQSCLLLWKSLSLYQYTKLLSLRHFSVIQALKITYKSSLNLCDLL